MAKPARRTDPRIDEAMNAVLEVERRSRESIEGCEREAGALLDGAQRRARAISARTDRRITTIRNRCEEETRRAVEQLLSEDRDRSQRSPEFAGEAARIEVAVRRFVARLTGEDTERNDPP